MLAGGAGLVILAIGAIAVRWIFLRYLYRNGTLLASLEISRISEISLPSEFHSAPPTFEALWR